MRNLLLTFFFLITFSITSFALDASVSFCAFKGGDQGYVELYLHFVGETIKHRELADGKLQAGVEVLVVFKQGEKVVKFDKFNLQSPITERRKDFIDLKRYGLENGKYDLVVNIVDLQNGENKRQFSTPIEIGFTEAALAQSDIQMLASVKKAAPGQSHSLVKNGIEVEPLPFNFYAKKMNELIFYNEIYNSDQTIGETFFISFSIQKASEDETGEVIMTGYKKLEPASVIPVLQKMDISEVPSGNYLFNVEVRNRNKELLSQKAVFFQRSNPSFDPAPNPDEELADKFVSVLTDDELEFGIRAVAPLVPNDAEMLNSIIAEKRTDAMKIYLLSFWSKQNPTEPEVSYRKYTEVAKAVDRQFNSGFGYGFETDRGLVYMKYGRPSDIISVEDEMSAPPYEIWSYNEFPKTNQNNVRFLFYNPSLSPGNYQLLHSTARTELNNPQWQLELYRDSNEAPTDGNFIDGTQMNDGFGRRAVEYFNDF